MNGGGNIGIFGYAVYLNILSMGISWVNYDPYISYVQNNENEWARLGSDD